MTEPRPPQDARGGPGLAPRQEPWLEPEARIPKADQPVDELTLRYREASDTDTRRPASRVREAARAHAEAMLATQSAMKLPPQTPAANQSRWKLSLLASVALAGLTGLLVLQFDRGSSDEQELAFGVAGSAKVREAAPPSTANSPDSSGSRVLSNETPGSPASAVARAVLPAAEPQAASPLTSASDSPSMTGTGPTAIQDKPARVSPPTTAPAGPSVQQNQSDEKKRAGFDAESKDGSMVGKQAARSALSVPSVAPVAPAPLASAAPAPAPARQESYAVSAPTVLARPAPFPASPALEADAANDDPPAPAVRGTPTPVPPNASSRARDSAGEDVAPEAPLQAPRLAAAPAPVAAVPPGVPAAPSTLSRAPALGELSRADEAPSSLPRRASMTSTLPLASALQEAARKGHASQLNRLLVRGAPLNAADTAGRTPLMLAVINNHPAMVQRLLAAGANVGLVDRNGLTALQHARRLGRDRIVTLIEEAS